ncbi:MAG TPA: DEAD/DEAH box helicase [Stellaceae bacterium]|nr:DEAD/DEAH box helicase [Stellaceae bacterium]
MTQFTDFNLAQPILKALADEGYVTPTPIQAQAIPGVIAGRDLLGIAQTGTGKTAAFALPILNRLANDKKPAPQKGARVLVLSPTRELASQIADSFRRYGAHLNLKVAVVFGGVSHGAQIQALARGLDVLVATPGRLVDHMDEGHARLDRTEVLVLDEVDQMLDLGFVKSIRKIVGRLPQARQNLFFSATMPPEIRGLAGELLTDPVEVSVVPASTTAERVGQRVIFVEGLRKKNVLVELLRDQDLTRTIVFTRTKRGADKVAQHLEEAKITAAAIHGNKSQNQRERSLAAFKDGKVRVLVATDIAARGIDIDAVSHVINYELPEVPEAYVHRIGRTARAGAEGQAISLCDNEERDLLRAIEKVTRQSLPSTDHRSTNPEDIQAEAEFQAEKAERARQRGRGQQRQGQQRQGQQRQGQQRQGQQRQGQQRQGQQRQDQQRQEQQSQGQRPQQSAGKPHHHGGERDAARPQRAQSAHAHAHQGGRHQQASHEAGSGKSAPVRQAVAVQAPVKQGPISQGPASQGRPDGGQNIARVGFMADRSKSAGRR